MKKLLIILVFSVALGACASKQEKTPEYVTKNEINERLASLEYSQKEWNSSKQSLARLILLENELKLLINQLAKMSDDAVEIVSEEKSVNDSPEQKVIINTVEKEAEEFTSIDEAVTQELPNETIPNLALEANVENNEVNDIEVSLEKSETSRTPEQSKANINLPFTIQLASITDKTALLKYKQEYLTKYPSLFEKFDFQFEQKIINDVEYFRLQVGEFDSKLSAQAYCDSLLTKTISCFVVKNNSARIKL